MNKKEKRTSLSLDFTLFSNTKMIAFYERKTVKEIIVNALNNYVKERENILDKAKRLYEEKNNI